MTISLCVKGREEMTEKIIIKPSVQKRFDSFMAHGRVLFFSAPCGFGKTVLADALLRGRNVLRQSAAAPDWAIPSSAQDWDILLIDDLQLMQEEAGQQALCELIRSSPERHFVLLSRGAPLGCLMAFQYTGLMTVLEADDLLFDADDVRRLFQLSGANVTDSEIDGILKESAGYPLGVAITARCMSPNKPWAPELVARVFHEVFLYFETAIYRRFDLPVRRFLLELAPFESFDLEMARMASAICSGVVPSVSASSVTPGSWPVRLRQRSRSALILRLSSFNERLTLTVPPSRNSFLISPRMTGTA